LVLAIVLAAGLSLNRRTWWFLLPAMPLLGHLYLTHMRGGRVALAAAALFALTAWGCSKVGVLRRPHTVMLVFIVFAAVGGAAALGLHWRQTGQVLPVDSSLALRYSGYFGASQMILDHPLSGHGPGNYVVAAPRYWAPYEQRWFARTGQKQPHVHNDLLEAAVEAGWAGAALYLLLFVHAVLGSLRLAFGENGARRLGLTLAACFLAFAVDGQFGFNLHVPVSAGLFFTLLGILEGLTAAGASQRRGARWIYFLLLLLGSVALAQNALSFTAEWRFQQARGALDLAKRASASGDTAGTAYLLRDGYVRLEHAHALLPWEPAFSRALGNFALEQRQFEAAIRHFDNALEQQPLDPGLLLQSAAAHVNRALALEAQQAAEAPGMTAELEAAEDAAAQALAVTPFLAEAEEVRGRCAMLRAVNATSPSRQPAWQRGEDAASTEWQEAIDRFNAALRLGSGNPAAILLLVGQAHMNLAQYDAAEAALLRAAELRPEETQVWPLLERLAASANRPGSYRKALVHALDVLKRSGAPPAGPVAEVEHRLGVIYLRDSQDPELASLLLRDALTLAPMHAEIWRSFAQAQPVIARLEAVQEQMQRIVAEGRAELLPTALQVVQHLETATPEELVARAKQLADTARLLAQDDRGRGILSRSPGAALPQPSENAVETEVGWLAELLLQALEQRSVPEASRGQLLTYIGSVFADAGRWQEADEVLVRALTLLPQQEQASALMLRSRAQDALGQPEIALDLARQAVQLAPDSPLVRWRLAQQLAANGLYAEANLEYLALIAQAIPGTPNYSKFQYELAELQKKMPAPPAPAPQQGPTP
ncbi:MAG: O-antigen ligase family protein, partial [Candidatus Hydrogenedentes bacterium]|nr:O-antigen ligase family protein [Candidatus Hydrogenedentota bacterium]